jgi:hypothetical protein|tara:strand:- start:284 stop:478 length:195 start_codon:yes stop_codon:yes gene_type:complete
MKVNLTKKDIECLQIGCNEHYAIVPDEFEAQETHNNYNQWQMTEPKLTKALAKIKEASNEDTIR